MSCMKCHYAQISSHSPTPSHMHMSSVKTVTGITNDPCIEPSLSHQYSLQVPMGNQSRVNPNSYHTTQSICDKYDRVSSLGNRTFQLTLRVSYTHTELFGSYRRSFTPMFQAFHMRGLTSPFFLRPTHIIYIYFYVLNRETFIRRRPKYELTTHSSTLMIDDPTHAHTPNIMQCPCEYAMLIPLHVLMLHV